jgi:hypothetical protein
MAIGRSTSQMMDRPTQALTLSQALQTRSCTKLPFAMGHAGDFAKILWRSLEIESLTEIISPSAIKMMSGTRTS